MRKTSSWWTCYVWLGSWQRCLFGSHCCFPFVDKYVSYWAHGTLFANVVERKKKKYTVKSTNINLFILLASWLGTWGVGRRSIWYAFEDFFVFFKYISSCIKSRTYIFNTLAFYISKDVEVQLITRYHTKFLEVPL